nr:alpha-tocopherol transfer protein-like [Rhipicephalus microplus]
MKEDLEVVARKELGETLEVIKESIDKFRKLLQEETDLRPPPDYVLLMFCEPESTESTMPRRQPWQSRLDGNARASSDCFRELSKELIRAPISSEFKATPDGKKVHDMNEELENIARIELGETPQVKEKCLSQLRKLLEEEEGFRVPPDDFLLPFLRTKKYRVDEAVKTVKNYFSARRDMPEVFDNLSPSTIEYDTVFRRYKLALFPLVRDSKGRAMAMLDFGSWTRDLCSIRDFMRCFIVGAECLLLDEETQIRGVVGVEDLKGLSVHHILELTPSFLRMLITLAQDTFPVRVKGMYFINTPTVFEGIYNIFMRPFISTKLKSRVHLVKGGLSELSDVFPLESLPKEYGGTKEDYDWDHHQRSFHDKAEHFQNVRLWGYVEK